MDTFRDGTDQYNNAVDTYTAKLETKNELKDWLAVNQKALSEILAFD